MAPGGWQVLASALAAQEGAWRAAHAGGTAWWTLAGRVLPWVGLALYLALVARALARRRRYRATDALGPDDVQALRAEVARAERATVGEILPVVLERSDEHPGARWLAAFALALLGSALAVLVAPGSEAWVVLAAQLACGALGWATARALPDFQRLFVREARATEMAEEQALQEFHRHALHETRERTGVLVFVSLFERRAIVLGDRGIDERVQAEDWRAATEAILRGIAAGSLRDGLAAGVRACGAVLAEHVPWRDGDRNELPDRVIVRRS